MPLTSSSSRSSLAGSIPFLSIIPAEPILSRPNFPRSQTELSSERQRRFSPLLTRRLSSLATNDDTSSLLRPISNPTSPLLKSHRRTLSCQPSLAKITPFSPMISRPARFTAEALLQRALEDDLEARGWNDQGEFSYQFSDDEHDLEQSTPLENHDLDEMQVGMDPLLAHLEAKSRLNVQTECAICQKKGINFPKCPKCQLEFCSRQCRVSMGDGERHKCA